MQSLQHEEIKSSTGTAQRMTGKGSYTLGVLFCFFNVKWYNKFTQVYNNTRTFISYKYISLYAYTHTHAYMCIHEQGPYISRKWTRYEEGTY